MFTALKMISIGTEATFTRHRVQYGTQHWTYQKIYAHFGALNLSLKYVHYSAGGVKKREKITAHPKNDEIWFWCISRRYHVKDRGEHRNGQSNGDRWYWRKPALTLTPDPKGVFIATQFNSTQLNSTRGRDVDTFTTWTTVDSVCRSWSHKQKHDWLGCTLFNWVSWVQLSWVVSL